MFTKQFRITNIECHSCVGLSTDVLKDLPGVTDVQIDQKTGAASLTSEHEIPWADIHKALEEVGKTSEEIANT
ncbi:MAG: hypothetical protein UX10_C0002G0026 [Candidatus Magasanikbacteria bacterium GW2011_GWA2_45_39]|uniref:HMA domain-containing protein n=2 Tax=Candidatus Magasanikiibacteriota TaxID=1752731 RepID=A0A0G1MZK9_9BACT|nr:MAG: hypothetical protein UX10_C0002G0026 [Candidatus Magasanikbacteria bacterium GW2011_GWA2_45_39]KKU13659.1 MAG: hypothetical protein UX20_C0016G0007 [Candidatus Magasanikbacteria bacterium GW2011_GWC2_45_8]HBW74269.1 copper-transporting ATPase [Candidatus Magasanikbacteria bacterium]